MRVAEPTFAEVPSRFREALACAILHEIDPHHRWKEREIAEVAGVTPAAVGGQVRRILRKLRAEAERRNIEREDVLA